jgi:hypothetical protein
MVKPTAQQSNQTKEKIKWTLVAVLCVVLLLVLYFNLKPSGDGKKTLVLQENKAEALDNSILLTPETGLMPALEALTDTHKTTNTMVPSMIQDIFSFASRKNSPDSAMMGPPEAEEFVLKGTIMDGDNSIAFLNDEIVGLGEPFNGFTVVEITATSITIKNEEDEITVLEEEDGLNEKLQM